MTRFVLQRSLHGLLSLAGIVLLVFVLSRLTGSPARLYLPEDATNEMVRQFNAENGFDQPIYMQLWNFITGVSHLDFGRSLLYNDSALSVVMTRYPATLKLAAVATIIFTVVGVLIGCIGAARRGTKADNVTRLTSLVALSVPDFWVGITGIAVFAVYLNVLPTSGAGGLQYWILPLIALSLRPIGVLTQVARSTMIEELDSEYVRVARSKGVGRDPSYSNMRYGTRRCRSSRWRDVARAVGERRVGRRDRFRLARSGQPHGDGHQGSRLCGNSGRRPGHRCGDHPLEFLDRPCVLMAQSTDPTRSTDLT